MATQSYSAALKSVLVHEGGYGNDPRDPGGATNRGVTQRVYDAFRVRRSLETRSVREITDIEVEAIYRAQYWNAVRGDDLPAGLDYAVFDGAVNSGPAQAVKWLQRALGVKVDGNLGEATLAAAHAHPDHDKLIADMLALRMTFLRNLKGWPYFGRGWTARVNDVRKRAQAWASGSVGPMPVVLTKGSAIKARPEDAKPTPSAAPADVAIGGGLGGGVVGGVIKQAQAQLEPVASVEWVQPILAVLAVASVVLVIGGIGWRAWQTYRAKKHAEALA